MIPEQIFYKTYQHHINRSVDIPGCECELAVMSYKTDDGMLQTQEVMDRFPGECKNFLNVPHRGIKLTDYPVESGVVILADTYLGIYVPMSLSDILDIIAKFGYSPEHGILCTCLYHFNKVMHTCSLVPMTKAEHEEYMIQNGPDRNLPVSKLKIGHYYRWGVNEGHYLGKMVCYNIQQENLHMSLTHSSARRWHANEHKDGIFHINLRGSTSTELHLFCDMYHNYRTIKNSDIKYIFNEVIKEYKHNEITIIPTYDELQVKVLRDLYIKLYQCSDLGTCDVLPKNSKIRYESFIFPDKHIEEQPSSKDKINDIIAAISPDGKQAMIFGTEAATAYSGIQHYLNYHYNIDYDGSITKVGYNNRRVIFKSVDDIKEKFPGFTIRYFVSGKLPYKSAILTKTTEGRVLLFKTT